MVDPLSPLGLAGVEDLLALGLQLFVVHLSRLPSGKPTRKFADDLVEASAPFRRFWSCVCARRWSSSLWSSTSCECTKRDRTLFANELHEPQEQMTQQASHPSAACHFIRFQPGRSERSEGASMHRSPRILRLLGLRRHAGKGFTRAQNTLNNFGYVKATYLPCQQQTVNAHAACLQQPWLTFPHPSSSPSKAKLPSTSDCRWSSCPHTHHSEFPLAEKRPLLQTIPRTIIQTSKEVCVRHLHSKI